MGCGASLQQQYGGIEQNQQQEQQNEQKEEEKFNTGEKITLKICSINLGEYQSPFKLYNRSFKRLGTYDQSQYNEQEQYQKQLNERFISISEIYKYKIKQKYINQNLIKLQKITKQRFTPLYRKDVGVNSNNYTLMSQKQFEAEWEKQFAPIAQRMKKDPSLQFDIFNDMQEYQLSKLQLKKFDLICYNTIVAYVYDSNDLLSITRQNLAHKYCLFMNSKFSKNQFDITQKIKSLQNFVKKLDIDITFVHEISTKYMNRIRQQFSSYRIVQPQANGTSAIFIKGDLINRLEPKYKNYTLNGLNYRYIDTYDKNFKNNFSSNEGHKHTAVLSQIRKRRQRQNALLLQKQMRQGKIDRKQIKIDQNSQIYMHQGTLVKQSNMLASYLVKIPTKNIQNQSMSSENQNNQQIKREDSNTDMSKIVLSKKNKLAKQQLNNFRLTEDSVIQFVGCFILISMRVSQFSQQKDKKLKSSVNVGQMERIKNVLVQLKRRFPRHKIIVGLNTPVSRQQVTKDEFLDHMELFRQKYKYKQQLFSFIPDVYSLVDDYQQEDRHMIGKQKLKRVVQKKGFFTTIYKKTNFNIDRKQINYQYTGVDSFLISTCKFENESTYNCQGEKISNQTQFRNVIEYIPNQKHPFTSLFIYSEIQVQLLQVLFNQN